jgi:hypothetical protein
MGYPLGIATREGTEASEAAAPIPGLTADPGLGSTVNVVKTGFCALGARAIGLNL